MCLNTPKNFNDSDVYQLLKSKQVNGQFVKKINYAHLRLEILHHHIHQEILEKLAHLGEEQGFFNARKLWGKGISTSIMPSYMYLRHFDSKHKSYQDVLAIRKKMKSIANQINAQTWLGYSQKPIQDIVNIGMGGSDLGPKFCYDALKSYQKNRELRFHFISDADAYSLQDTLAKLNPETTLFIVSSKSFSTKETLSNAEIARHWMGHAEAMHNHFIAITAHPEKAQALGYQHVIHFGQWVVGRYSSCSAINLINAIAWGYGVFQPEPLEFDLKHFLFI